MSDYTDRLVLDWLRDLRYVEVVSDLHVHDPAVICERPPEERTVVEDTGAGFALCKHLRHVVPPDLLG